MYTKSFSAAILAVLILVSAGLGCAQSQKKTVVISKSRHRGWLGVQVQDVTKRLKAKESLPVDRGAYVVDVVEESPAEKAGIAEGDVIVRVGEDTIENSADLTEAVRALKPKSEVQVEVVRKSERKQLSATLGRSPGDLLLGGLAPMPSIRPFAVPRDFSVYVNTDRELYGLEVQDLTSQLGEYFEAPNGKGVLIMEVKKGSAADKAGFRAGDVITKVDKRSVADVEDFRDELSDREEGNVPVEVVRKGKALTLTLPVESESDDDDAAIINTVPHTRSTELKRLGQELREKMHELRESLRRELRKL
jgi:serine protease Do